MNSAEVRAEPAHDDSIVTDFTQYKRIVVSICGGAEMLRLPAIKAGLDFDAWVCIEWDEKVRQLALQAHCGRATEASKQASKQGLYWSNQ